MIGGPQALLLVIASALATQAGAANLAGDYVADEEPGVGLTLAESNGEVTGALREGGSAVPLLARGQSTGFAGLIGAGGDMLPVTGAMDGDRLVLTIGAEDEVVRLTFRRTDGGVPADTAASPTATRRVVINGQVLTDIDLGAIEQMYRVHIDNAEYWYDRTLGAWGLAGGPTRGFVTPGLNLGGPLRADASGGGTMVFVNGRALHPLDVMVLQQLTGVIAPGRYFITAEGLAGYEGGPPLWNLLAMAQQATGGSNTWQSRLTGASGFSDGTTGAVFLPNGGIVSTGQ